MRRRIYPAPRQALTLDQKLEKIYQAFKAKLALIAQLASTGVGEAHQYAAQETAGMPKKHVVASTFALCEETLHLTLGDLWWRCSMSESTSVATPIRMVKTILAAIESQPSRHYDEWPPIEEFMHDFSASSHSIPQITGKKVDYVWDDQPFQLKFAAESEMALGNPEVRANAITRDLVKLCLVECPIKVVVYRGYDIRPTNIGKREQIIDRIMTTIRQCPSPGNRNLGWLFIGLIGRWPDTIKPYLHTMNSNSDEAKLQNW